ncbi:MAG: hypothetical protein ACRCU6_07030 [Fusobacteriaceae bacterium]
MTTIEKVILTQKISEELKIKLLKYNYKIDKLLFDEENNKVLEMKLVRI